MTDPARKPRDDEIDLYGLTDIGRKRLENQDHFLVCTLHKRMRVHHTSLPDSQLPIGDERLASLALVADGVGGHAAGQEASRLTLEEVASYVTNTMHCYYTTDSHHEELFMRELQESVLRGHARVLENAAQYPERGGMATTLTMVMTVWPRVYILQVGDSRCYRVRDGRITQLTRDQTMAQEMVDMGVMDEDQARESKWGKVLSSAIGVPDSVPVLLSTDVQWGDAILLCSDGLTKHLTDDDIRDRVVGAASSEEACRALVNEALNRGGTDNVTVVIGRLPRE